MPIGKGVVMGERTSQQGITQVAQAFVEAGATARVIVASLPRTRWATHLDSVTFCDADLVTALAPVIDAIAPFKLRDPLF